MSDNVRVTRVEEFYYCTNDATWSQRLFYDLFMSWGTPARFRCQKWLETYANNYETPGLLCTGWHNRCTHCGSKLVTYHTVVTTVWKKRPKPRKFSIILLKAFVHCNCRKFNQHLEKNYLAYFQFWTFFLHCEYALHGLRNSITVWMTLLDHKEYFTTSTYHVEVVTSFSKQSIQHWRVRILAQA